MRQLVIHSSIELFSGAGGLALGMSKAGFHHALLVESNLDAINTLRHNHDIGQTQIREWNIIYSDIKDMVFKNYKNKIKMVAGGPPCQPFSLAGKHQGKNDDRDMFPEAVRVVREIQPNSFVFENVKGLLTKSFSTYFEYILLQLKYPEITRQPKQKWVEHLSHLKKINTQALYSGLKYNVVFKLLNAADYGVPQKRERVFIVGFRSDIDMG
ncbi:C-5 cytosine-specific DNA methylase, partial [Candidatus Thiomargarita nelsonii]